jgi:hypothetical protein
MPFYLYGTPEEMHIDHVLLQAPNAQISAGEVAVELIEGDESAFTAGLKNGFIAVADTLPEHLMQPLTADSLSRFFHPGAKLDVSIYDDQDAVQSRRTGLCDNLGKPITRATITLGDNTFVDSYMLNLDIPVVKSQESKNSTVTAQSTGTSQDHPLFCGYGLTDRHSSTKKGWREVWDKALASRRFADDDLDSGTNSTESDTESFDYWPSLLP